MTLENNTNPLKDKISVAIVESDIIVANSLKESLEHNGYSVLNCFTSAESFLKNSSSLRADVLLIDITLEGAINGVELADMIQPSANSAIIFMSSHLDRSILNNTRFESGYALLAKPIGNRELISTIEREFAKQKNLLNQPNSKKEGNFNLSSYDSDIIPYEPVEEAKSQEAVKRDFLNEVLFQTRYLESSFNEILGEPQVLILISDKNGIINYVNDTALKTYSFDTKKLFNQNLFEIIHPEEIENVKFALKSCINEPKSQIGINIRIKSSAHKWFYFNCIFQLLPNNNGTPYIAITCLNIGKLKDVGDVLNNLENQIVHDFDDVELAKLRPSINIFQIIVKEIISKRKKNLNNISNFVNESFHSIMGFSAMLSEKVEELSEIENVEFKQRIQKHVALLRSIIEKNQGGGFSAN